MYTLDALTGTAKGGYEVKGSCGECERRWACEIDPDKCDEWPDPAPTTNGDKIRSMSDEELNNFLRKVADCIDKCPYEFGYEKALNWLQEPAKEDSE